mmetsp:Transcript_34292/g.41442  ORF Transcript_34292/g.41442 Transcript_34292/m.41442 type:complete len:174 (-) Transcript_34292:208-729(-)|eukprot:CAMPEP_0197863960 /NCGR_PEP_ID=MMETSP1438-20131217/41793_1 /TAXON_ID=1461541 /ORGANISM="Pterosperma sp., Strain CCMP1384" /LENGTH=173 /DNA_ID=CAMNT_0043482031 /DNA_START=45 /DNA_END=566 /DNA_ORIENTATION=-
MKNDRAYDASRYDSDSDEETETPVTSGAAAASQEDERTHEGPVSPTTDTRNTERECSVWENLQNIFDDLDRQGDSTVTEAVEVPLSRLRHLLQQHNKLKVRESELNKVNVGLLVEASSFLHKLRGLEDLTVMTIEGHDFTPGHEEAELRLAENIRAVLNAEDSGFQLTSSSSM